MCVGMKRITMNLKCICLKNDFQILKMLEIGSEQHVIEVTRVNRVTNSQMEHENR